MKLGAKRIWEQGVEAESAALGSSRSDYKETLKIRSTGRRVEARLVTGLTGKIFCRVILILWEMCLPLTCLFCQGADGRTWRLVLQQLFCHRRAKARESAETLRSSGHWRNPHHQPLVFSRNQKKPYGFQKINFMKFLKTLFQNIC